MTLFQVYELWEIILLLIVHNLTFIAARSYVAASQQLVCEL